MSQTITIEVWDTTGNRKQPVEVPSDAPVNRLIAVLVERMNLPRQSPDNQIMSYKLHHRRSGRQLLDQQTLAEADVRDGDIVRLQPEITAGAGATGGVSTERPTVALGPLPPATLVNAHFRQRSSSPRSFQAARSSMT